MTRVFTPRPWQPPMIEHGLKLKRCAILARMGMGKSSATLSIIDALLMGSGARRILVVAPLRVARSTWPEEVSKWEEFAHIRVQPITGDVASRKAALRNDKADVYTVHYDVITWLIDTIGPEQWPFDMVIADEATKLKNFRLKQGGKRAQALAQIAHTKVDRWVNLTGTFAPNGLVDLWGPMWFVDQGHRLGLSFDGFEKRWFGFQHARDALHAHRTHIKQIVFPHSQAEIIGRIKDVALAFNPKDWFPIKQPIVVPIMVDLPPESRKRYREMERDMFTTVGGYDIEAFAAAGKVIKCIAENTEVLTGRGWVPIKYITAADFVWDGVDWVPTEGSICNGYKPVLDCWGVLMTPDHKVLTPFGWQEAQEIMDADARHGINRPRVRLPDRNQEGRIFQPSEVETGNVAMPVRVRGRSGEDRGQPASADAGREKIVWLSSWRNATGGLGHPRHDRAPCMGDVVQHEVSLREPERQRLAKLRRARDRSVQALVGFVRRLLGGHGPDLDTGAYAGAATQRRQLHAEKLPVGHGRGTIEQPPRECTDKNPGWSNDRRASGAEVWDQGDHDPQTYREGVGPREPAKSAWVFDVLNAGPRNRFTVRGGSEMPAIIVHNCLQLANGAIYTGSDEQVERDVSPWVEAHDEKLLALEEIIEEAQGEPVMVVYHFKPDLVRLKKRFPHGRHIHGKKDEDAFKAGEIPIAFVHASSIGHGVDGFQNVCHIIVFFALWWDLETHDQIIERIGPMRQEQAGFDREVMVYMILARGTVDETVAARLVAKRHLQDVTMDSLAHKPIGEQLW